MSCLPEESDHGPGDHVITHKRMLVDAATMSQLMTPITTANKSIWQEKEANKEDDDFHSCVHNSVSATCDANHTDVGTGAGAEG